MPNQKYKIMTISHEKLTLKTVACMQTKVHHKTW